MSRWYRAYVGLCNDDKLQEAAHLAECSRAIVIATWHVLLEGCATNDGSEHGTTARRVAVVLGEKSEIIGRVFDALSELGLLDGERVAKWDARQFKSDSSRERVARYRARQAGDVTENQRTSPSRDGDAPLRNGDVTLHERYVTAPDTEAETETDTKPVGFVGARDARRPTNAAPSKSETGGTRLPADWAPDIAFALGEGFCQAEAEREADKFRDYWRAVAGAKGRKKDWPATWRVWVRSAAERRPRSPPPPVYRNDGPGEFVSQSGTAHLRAASFRRRADEFRRAGDLISAESWELKARTAEAVA